MKAAIIPHQNWNIEFTYSPLFEMLCSLHVLSAPEHHLQRLSWAEEMRQRLPETLYNKLNEFSELTGDWCVIMDFCNSYEECDDFNVIRALDFIEDISLESFQKTFGKHKRYGECIFDEKLKSEMVRLLKEYYLFYFERELRYVEPFLVRQLKKAAERCRLSGALAYIGELHNRIEITNEAFLFYKYTLFTIPFDKLERVIIRISSFIDPHLLMDYEENMVQFTIRVHLDKDSEEVPKDLLRLMKALSDDTRLRIVKSIRRSRATTQSLATELGISEAGISKHLKLLYDADLVYKERGGSFIYYYLNLSLIDHIPMGLHEFLG